MNEAKGKQPHDTDETIRRLTALNDALASGSYNQWHYLEFGSRPRPDPFPDVAAGRHKKYQRKLSK